MFREVPLRSTFTAIFYVSDMFLEPRDFQNFMMSSLCEVCGPPKKTLMQIVRSYWYQMRNSDWTTLKSAVQMGILNRAAAILA